MDNEKTRKQTQAVKTNSYLSPKVPHREVRGYVSIQSCYV